MTTPTIAAKQCATCQESFTSTHPHKIYCSEKCSAKAKRTRRNQNPQWVELQRKRHREARLRKHQPAITQLPTKQCESCQTPFELRQPNKRYCSERCRRKAKRERTEHPSRSTLRTKTCTECKQTFTQTGSGGTNAKLCKYCKPRSPHYKHRARIQLQKLISASHKRQRKQTAQMHLDAQCVICNEWYKLRTVGVVGGQRTCSTACGNKQEHRRPARIKAARAKRQRLKQDPDWVERERERLRKYNEQRKNDPKRQQYLYEYRRRPDVQQRIRQREALRGQRCRIPITHPSRTNDLAASKERAKQYARDYFHYTYHVLGKKENYYKNAAIRRAKIKGSNADKDITYRKVFERDAYKCRHCAKRVRTDVPRSAPNKAILGHINALAAGGTHTWDNVCTLCYTCNMKDGVNKIPIQYKLA